MKKTQVKQKLNQLAAELIDLFQIEPVKFRFEDLGKEDSRFYIQEEVIAIHENYQENELEAVKSLIHEFRHVYQIYYAFFRKDNIADIWRKEFQDPFQLTDYNDMEQLKKYFNLQTEIDAFAFTQLYMKNLYELDIVHPIEQYQKKIDDHKKLLVQAYPNFA